MTTASSVEPHVDRVVPLGPGRDSVRGSKRLDIQGLRSLAVGMVIVYHIWPDALPGGFVGVDAFFVISGFLIVGSLVRDVSASGRIRVPGFYAKRVRRLIPAACAVLIVTLVATVLVLPQSRWQSVSMDVVMSGLQVQNWNQAFSASSYEGATSAVSPVQHYWSLAVEEQFYVLIPWVLMAGAGLAVRLRMRPERVGVIFVAAITVASFVHSMLFSATEHNIAYFATTTRMWELGVGGLGAVFLPKLELSRRTSAGLAWLGFGALVVAAATFTTSMEFPGSVAFMPVLGTLLIIWAGTPQRQRRPQLDVSVNGLLSLRPLTFVGDISYSLYLWHWPVVVFYVAILGRAPGYLHGSAIVALSLALAVMSYFLIEQRFRNVSRRSVRVISKRQRTGLRGRGALQIAAGSIALSTICAAVPWSIVEIKAQLLSGELNLRDYPGATALDPRHPANVDGSLPVRPDPALASKDVPLPGKDECGVFDPSSITIDHCIYGQADAARTMVVVGDSHAAQYVDALLAAGAPTGWNVRAMVRNGCPFSAAPPSDGTVVYSNCSEQNKITLQRILLLHPKLVVVSGMAMDGYQRALKWKWDSNQTLVDGYVSLLGTLRSAGIRVAVLKDNPYPDLSIPECVLQHGAHLSICDSKARDQERTPDALELAGHAVQGVEVVDLSSYFCRDGRCPAVIGNVLVYRDNHLTNTYAKTLAPALADRLGL